MNPGKNYVLKILTKRGQLLKRHIILNCEWTNQICAYRELLKRSQVVSESLEILSFWRSEISSSFIAFPVALTRRSNRIYRDKSDFDRRKLCSRNGFAFSYEFSDNAFKISPRSKCSIPSRKSVPNIVSRRECSFIGTAIYRLTNAVWISWKVNTIYPHAKNTIFAAPENMKIISIILISQQQSDFFFASKRSLPRQVCMFCGLSGLFISNVASRNISYLVGSFV